MARASELPVVFEHGHAIVAATLNGGAARLAFDTGAFTSLLSEAAVNRLQLRRMQGEEIRNTLAITGGIGGQRSARYVTAHKVELGGLRGRDYNFTASDFGGSLADGLLSIDMVSQFDFPPCRQTVGDRRRYGWLAAAQRRWHWARTRCGHAPCPVGRVGRRPDL